MNDGYSEILEKIDRYLQNQMGHEERLDFEEILTKDESVKGLMEGSVLVKDLLLDHKTLVFKNKVSDLIQKENSIRAWRKTSLALVIGMSLLGIIVYPKLKQAQSENIQPIGKKVSREIGQESDKVELISENKHELEKLTPIQRPPVQKSEVQNLENNEEGIGLATIQAEEKRELSPNLVNLTEPISIKDSTSKNDLKFDCSKTLITFTPIITATCKGKNEGSISVSESITGGKEPYVWHVGGVAKFITEKMEHLYAGDYQIEIRDHNNCSSSLMVTIASKNCIDFHEYSLDPYADNILSFGFASEEKLTLAVYQKDGKLLLFKDIGIGNEMVWDGKDSDGIILSNGVYLYSISNGEGLIEKGYVSIINSR